MRQLRQYVRVKPTLFPWCLVWQRVCLCSIPLEHSHWQEPSGIWSGLGGRIRLQCDCQHWPLSFWISQTSSPMNWPTYCLLGLLLNCFGWQNIEESSALLYFFSFVGQKDIGSKSLRPQVKILIFGEVYKVESLKNIFEKWKHALELAWTPQDCAKPDECVTCGVHTSFSAGYLR